LAGVALFALALAVVAIAGGAVSGQTMAILVLGAMLGFVLDATWLTQAVDRLSKLGRDSEDEDGDGGWENQGLTRCAPGPRPRTPSSCSAVTVA